MKVVDPFNPTASEVEVKLARAGLDISIAVFQVHGVDEHLSTGDRPGCTMGDLHVFKNGRRFTALGEHPDTLSAGVTWTLL